MSKFLKNGNLLRVAEIESTFEKLPIGVYNLGLDQKGYFLTKTSDFKFPKKIYGDLSIVDRCIKTYESKKRNVGILLSGLKGGGKTITAKLLATKINKPIINISAPYSGPEFIDFITDPILGDCVIFLDEYEKTYCNNKNSDDGNDSLLSLLDGPYETHHLFIFTVNQTNINSNLINRPSRILYSKEYHGLSQEDVIEIAEDKLEDKTFMEDLLITSNKIYQLSFDILISLIEEVNRFHEPASKCIEYMNLTPRQTSFNIKQWYINEEGKVESDYAGWNCGISYDEEGDMIIIVHYNYTLCYKDGQMRRNDTDITVKVNDIKKVNNDTYEVFLKTYNGLFTLTEAYSDTSYGYGSKNIYRPKNITNEKLVVYLDENSNYVRHTPSDIKLETVKEIIGSRYFGDTNEKDLSKKIYKEDCGEEYINEECDGCCCGSN